MINSEDIINESSASTDTFALSPYTGYAGLSDFVKCVLTIEKQLNPLVSLENSLERKTKVTRMQAEFKALPDTFINDFAYLSKILKAGITYIECLQARRLMNTMEYSLINSYAPPALKKAATMFESAFKNKKLTDISTAIMDDKAKREERQLTLIHGVLAEIWTISFDDFKQLWGTLKIARHGAESVSANATWEQKEGTCGELLLCKPMIMHINQLSMGDHAIYTWKPDQLIVQILQGTTRRYKMLTILDCVLSVQDMSSTLVGYVERQRITKEAFSSLKQYLGTYLIEGVSAKAKEQVRQITTLLHILQTKPDLNCIGYEVLASRDAGSEIRADMLFQSVKGGQYIVVEIEGLPMNQKENACAYLLERYEIKSKTLQPFLAQHSYQLIVVVPVGTAIPSGEWVKLKSQTQLIWSVES